MEYDLKNPSRYLEALAEVLGKKAAADPEWNLDTSEMPPDLALLSRTLLHFRGHATLGPWDFGLLNEESSRQMVRQAGGEPQAEKSRLIGLAMDNTLLAVAAYDGPDGSASVYVTDDEYAQVKRVAYFLKDWIEQAYTSPEQGPGSVRDAMRSVFTQLEAPVPELQSAEADPDHNALRRQPDPETVALLKAGDHMYWSFVGDGPAASVHKKGLRFVGADGKSKSRNMKTTIEIGSLAPEGHCGLILWKGDLYRVEVPSAEIAQLTRDDTRSIHGFAHLCNDLVVLRQDNEVVLYRLDGNNMHEIERITSLDLGARGPLQRVFDGTWFVVSNNGQEVSWLFRVADDRMQAVYQLPGFLDPLDRIYGPIPGDEHRLGLTLWAGGKARLRRGVLERP
ncbi:MAG: hypothetical protein GF331_08095 [Chitinivibrionales bacterium]|nr:hypothetical protein [Chitinivibrionales bacterium]